MSYSWQAELCVGRETLQLVEIGMNLLGDVQFVKQLEMLFL